MNRLQQTLLQGKRVIKRVTGRTFRPELTVPVERHGSNYGGWWVTPEGLGPDSVVYSFGIGEDISFDLSLIKTYGVQIYAFDPTPRSLQWLEQQALPANFHVFPYGIAGHDGTVQFHPPTNPAHVSHTILKRPHQEMQLLTVPVYRLQSIMNMLGHKQVDLLKMDVEGAEYMVIEDLEASRPPVSQLLVEFHHHFPEVSWRQSREAVSVLRRMGYRLFQVSQQGNELSFLQSAK